MALRGIRATRGTQYNVESQVFTPNKFGSTAGNRPQNFWLPGQRVTTRPHLSDWDYPCALIDSIHHTPVISMWAKHYSMYIWQGSMLFLIVFGVVLQINSFVTSESLVSADFKKANAGFQVSPYVGYVQSLQKVRSLLECASICRYTEKCMTYVYDTDTCMTFWRPPLFLHTEVGQLVYSTSPGDVT